MAFYDHNTMLVDSVADLASVSPGNNQIVKTLGYFTAGDGGSNEYRFVQGNSDPCDGGLTLDGPAGDNSPLEVGATYAGTSAQGRYKALDQKHIFPEQFGAGVGHGSEAFRRAALEGSGLGFGSATYDPISLADGAGESVEITALGATLGDGVVLSFTNDVSDISVTADVTAADLITARFQNESGGLLDLASGTVRARTVKL